MPGHYIRYRNSIKATRSEVRENLVQINLKFSGTTVKLEQVNQKLPMIKILKVITLKMVLNGGIITTSKTS